MLYRDDPTVPDFFHCKRRTTTGAVIKCLSDLDTKRSYPWTRRFLRNESPHEFANQKRSANSLFFSKMPCAMRHLDTFAPFVACSNLSSHRNQWKFWTSAVTPCDSWIQVCHVDLLAFLAGCPTKARACLSKSENVQLVVDSHDDIVTCIVDLEA